MGSFSHGFFVSHGIVVSHGTHGWHGNFVFRTRCLTSSKALDGIHGEYLSLTELMEIFLIFHFAQEITITQHNKSKLFSASFNRNFPTDYTDLKDFFVKR